MLIKLISEGKLTEAEELFKSQLSEKASELVGNYKDAAYASLFESFLIEKEEADVDSEDEEDEMEGDEEPVEESDEDESEDDEESDNDEESEED